MHCLRPSAIRNALPRILLASLLLGGVGTAFAQEQTTSFSASDYSETGAKACLKCHDEAPTNNILHRAHAQGADPRTPFASHACETCHGPSMAHREAAKDQENRPTVDIQFGMKSPTPAADQNEVCLGCHESGLRINWRGSQHDFADVPCSSCHNLHGIRDEAKGRETQRFVCYDCHPVVRAENQRFSHHPIREGKVVCSDCHNPHGSFGPVQLKKATVNETCFQCHADKRGPFLWEHVPVVEDCSNCHTPHGSTQPRLLKARTPWLCQNCHLAAFHPSTAYDGADVPPMGFDQHTVAGGCLNCHSQVHGSNHPSGARFMR